MLVKGGDGDGAGIDSAGPDGTDLGSDLLRSLSGSRALPSVARFFGLSGADGDCECNHC